MQPCVKTRVIWMDGREHDFLQRVAVGGAAQSNRQSCGRTLNPFDIGSPQWRFAYTFAAIGLLIGNR